MASNETGSGMSAQGSVSLKPYVTVGPAFQTPGLAGVLIYLVIQLGEQLEQYPM